MESLLGIFKRKVSSFKTRSSRGSFDSMGNGLSSISSFRSALSSVNTEQAMRFTAVYAAIRLRSDDGSFPT